MSSGPSDESYRSTGFSKREFRLKIRHLQGISAEWVIDKDQADVVRGIIQRAEKAEGKARYYCVELGLNTAEDVVIIPAYLFWDNQVWWSIEEYD